MANQLLVRGSSGAAPPVARAGQRQDEWLDTAFQVAMQLCKAIRAEASSRSSSSCQTADWRRHRCECCWQQGGRARAGVAICQRRLLLLHLVTATM
ncbi:hypothetical protein V8C26DRAFT_131393 [Trichoderma gracile]